MPAETALRQFTISGLVDSSPLSRQRKDGVVLVATGAVFDQCRNFGQRRLPEPSHIGKRRGRANRQAVSGFATEVVRALCPQGEGCTSALNGQLSLDEKSEVIGVIKEVISEAGQWSAPKQEKLVRRATKKLKKNGLGDLIKPETPVTYPSWTETVQTLTEKQILAARVVTTGALFTICLDDAHSQLPYLEHRREYTDSDGRKIVGDEFIIAQHIAGLLAAIDQSHPDPNDHAKQGHWDLCEKGDYYTNRAELFVSPRLDSAQDNIFYHAQYWEPADQSRVMLSAVKSVKKKFGKEQQRLFRQRTPDLTDEMLSGASKDWMKTIAISGGSELLSLTAGVLASKFNVLEFIPKTWDEAATWGIYAPMVFMNFHVFRKENLKLLSQKGISMVPFSKMGEVFSRQHIKDRRNQEIVINSCYTAEQLAREVPYFGLLLEGNSYFTNANIVSLGFMFGKYGLSKWIRSRQQTQS